MKGKITLLCMIFMFGIIHLATSQTIITGTIKDADNEPMVGASISVNGTNVGAVADANGKFTLKTNQALPVTLRVTMIGYKN